MIDSTRSTTFVVTLEAPAGSKGVRALRALLKTALRRHGLRAVDAWEEVTAEGELAQTSRRNRPNANYRKKFAELRQSWKGQDQRT